QEKKIEVSHVSSEVDLLLSQLMIDYNIIQREQLQKILHLQTTLRSLGIIRSLDELIIATKTLATDMIKPLVAECIRRKENKLAPTNILGQTGRIDKQKVDTLSALKTTQRLEISKTVPSQKLSLGISIIGICTILLLIVTVFTFTPKTKKTNVITNTETAQQNVSNTSLETNTNNTQNKTNTTSTLLTKSDEKQISTTDTSISENLSTTKISAVIKSQELSRLLVHEIILSKADLKCENQAIEGYLEITLGKISADSEFQYKLELWDLWKEKNYWETIVRAKNKGMIRCALPKKLWPGFYYIHFIFSHTLQEADWQKILPIQDIDWWIPLVVDSKEISKLIPLNIKKFQTSIGEIKKQMDELQKFSNESLSQQKNRWQSFNKRWQERHKQIMELWKLQEDIYLIPFCAPIQKNALHILKNLEHIYQDVEAYVQGFSLLPPEILIKTSSLTKSVQNLENSLVENQQIWETLIKQFK
ncbi:MAG: hypothetical protein NZM44_02090, partial [Candidatus Calescibacterium sp.]|nr:hypothetical protein [Candidatus Calescibacterium sp.]